MIKKKIKDKFDIYTSGFNSNDPKVAMKISHSDRVADISEEIAKSLGDQVDVPTDYFWILGLLHDIGRFEQYKRYGTFSDLESVDHAEFGADLLFEEGLIDYFFSKESAISELVNYETHMEKAIRLHNKLSLPPSLSPKEKMICSVIRDADKIDIFRVTQEIPFEVRMARKDEDNEAPASEEVMQYIRNHECVPKIQGRNSFECHVAGCAMAFDLVFPKSMELVREQGHLKQMLFYDLGTNEQKRQMEEIRKELSYYC